MKGYRPPVFTKTFSSLKLTAKGSWLEPLIQTLMKDLRNSGFHHFEPLIYVGDEWFSPEGTPAIAIPFYLLSKELMSLEMKIMHWVEGGTVIQALKLLRHEAGHAVDHAYGISKCKEFQKFFGNPAEAYKPESECKPYSRKFVHHLDLVYAQTHPTEDFAETFASYITPHNNWKIRHKNCPTLLEKFRYIDRLTNRIGKLPPKVAIKKEPKFFNIRYMDLTIGSYYRQRIKDEGHQHRGFYDRRLRQIFCCLPRSDRASAYTYLKENQLSIFSIAKSEIGFNMYQTGLIFDQFLKRTRKMNLAAPARSSSFNKRIAALLVEGLRNSLQ